jgi:hypothetical protein
MAFHAFSSGHAHSFGGQCLEWIAHQRIRATDRFDAPPLSGEIQVCVELGPVPSGTDWRLSRSGIPQAIPQEMCVPGGQASLAQIAMLVEAEPT